MPGKILVLSFAYVTRKTENLLDVSRRLKVKCSCVGWMTQNKDVVTYLWVFSCGESIMKNISCEWRAAVIQPLSSPPPEASSAAKSSSSSRKLWDAWTSLLASKSSGRGTSPHTLEAWVTCKHTEIYRGWSLGRKVTPCTRHGPRGGGGRTKVRRETGHCDVFTLAIHYLFSRPSQEFACK